MIAADLGRRWIRLSGRDHALGGMDIAFPFKSALAFVCGERFGRARVATPRMGALLTEKLSIGAGFIFVMPPMR